LFTLWFQGRYPTLKVLSFKEHSSDQFCCNYLFNKYIHRLSHRFMKIMLFCKRFNSMLYSSFSQSFHNNYIRLSRVLFRFKDFNFKPNLSIAKQNFSQNNYIYNNLNLVQIKNFSNDSQSNQKWYLLTIFLFWIIFP
jgi:hypothetical protein